MTSPAKTGALAAIALLAACLSSCSDLRQNISGLGRDLTPKEQIPFRSAMVNGELLFVLEVPAKVEEVRVETKSGGRTITMWHAGCTELEYSKCPEVGQIKYGQGVGALVSWAAPRALQRNNEYEVRMNLDGSAFAFDTFVIVDERTVTVPAPRSREIVDISTITVDMNGVQGIVPYSVTFSSGGDRAVVVTGPVQK